MSWRQAERADWPVALLWAFGAVVAMSSAPLLPTLARMLPPCALHALTGVPCVACGSTRAALALAHGRPLQALALNPLAAMAMMGGLLGGIVAPGWVAMHGPLPKVEGAAARWLRIALWAAIGLQWLYLVIVRR